MDEKGFQMGQISKTRVVFNKTDGPPASAATGTTSWVSIIECVTAVGDAINPFVIHIGKEIQDRWFLPDNELPDWRWGFSTKGWTNNALGYDWLKEWFIPRTTRAQNHRLLILDGHESHESVEFESAASLNHVHLFFLPLHSSGVLQPLDTGAFSPLATYYRGKLQKYTPDGFATISRDTFARIYIEARPLAFTPRNIRVGWKTAGFNPINPQKIKDVPSIRNWERTTPDLEVPAIPEGSLDTTWTTPKKTTDIIAFANALAADSTPTKRIRVMKLAHAAIQMDTRAEIATHELRAERERRKEAIKKQKSMKLSNDGSKVTWERLDIIEARKDRSWGFKLARRRWDRKLRGILTVWHPRVNEIRPSNEDSDDEVIEGIE